jgi:hypothetical protein
MTQQERSISAMSAWAPGQTNMTPSPNMFATSCVRRSA